MRLHQRFTWIGLALLVTVTATVANSEAAIAQSIDLDEITLLLLTDPLDPNLLQPGVIPTDSTLVTADTVAQNPEGGITRPSLWWTQEQFGGKLLDTWVANPGLDGTPPRVDLIVNQQVWSLYGYLERYTFLNQFGTVAYEFGYSTRIFNRQQELLAAYICPIPSQPSCTVFLDPSGPNGLQGEATSIEPLSTGDGNAQP